MSIRMPAREGENSVATNFFSAGACMHIRARLALAISAARRTAFTFQAATCMASCSLEKASSRELDDPWNDNLVTLCVSASGSCKQAAKHTP